MPRVEIGTAYGVTVKVEANEASVEELRKQAMDSFREACQIEYGQPTGPAFGFSGERRGTPDHRSTRFGPGRVDTHPAEDV